MSAGAAVAPALEPEPQQPPIEQQQEQPTEHRSISEAKLAANRANAVKSTGPVTAEGKAKSSLNAVKTGLTGRTILLSTEEAAVYEAHIERYFSSLAPADEEERTLVQVIADTQWRLLSIAPLETAIYALGARKLGNLFDDEADPARRHHLMQAEVFLTFRRDFSNLNLQESRLSRQLEKTMAKLDALQDRRKSCLADQLTKSTKLHQQAKQEGKAFDPAEFGFEFSKEEFLYWRERAERQFRLIGSRPDFEKVVAELRNRQKAA